MKIRTVLLALSLLLTAVVPATAQIVFPTPTPEMGCYRDELLAHPRTCCVTYADATTLCYRNVALPLVTGH